MTTLDGIHGVLIPGPRVYKVKRRRLVRNILTTQIHDGDVTLGGDMLEAGFADLNAASSMPKATGEISRAAGANAASALPGGNAGASTNAAQPAAGAATAADSSLSAPHQEEIAECENRQRWQMGFGSGAFAASPSNADNQDTAAKTPGRGKPKGKGKGSKHKEDTASPKQKCATRRRNSSVALPSSPIIPCTLTEPSPAVPAAGSAPTTTGGSVSKKNRGRPKIDIIERATGLVETFADQEGSSVWFDHQQNRPHKRLVERTIVDCRKESEGQAVTPEDKQRELAVKKLAKQLQVVGDLIRHAKPDSTATWKAGNKPIRFQQS